MSAASIVIKLGIASVVLPAAGFAVGLVLQATIPGCHCDEGAGCGGCGAMGSLISFLIFGGFAGALGALLFALPASLALAGAIRCFPKRTNATGTFDFIEPKPLFLGILKRLLLVCLVIAAVIALATLFWPKN